MKPRVEIYPDKNFKGTPKFYSSGTHELKESFTQNELVGKTFFIINCKLGNDGKKYAVDNGGCKNKECYYHLYQYDPKNINQVFTMLSNGVIKSVMNGLVMDVSGGSFKNGTRIWNYPQNNTPAQQWEYNSNTKNLKLKGKNFVLSVDGDKMQNTSKLWVWEADGNIAQQWDIQLCDVKDTFRARERFALRFYNPVPSFNDIYGNATSTSTSTSSTSKENYGLRFFNPVPSFNDIYGGGNTTSTSTTSKENYGLRFFNPVPSFNDIYAPKSIQEQRQESFNTCQAIIYQHTGGGGYKSKVIPIGDYAKITQIETEKFCLFNCPPANIKNDDISSVKLFPFTDVFLYQDYDYKGKVWHIHNGKSSEWLVDLTTLGCNDNISSIKVRAGLIDDKQSNDNNDTSGSSVCNIRYKAHMANKGWLPWVSNGAQAGTLGGEMEAITFEYSGPGQMYARAHVSNKGWLPWVSSGEVCGTTGQHLRLQALEFKIDGVSNVFFGLDIYSKGKGWLSRVGLNKIGGTTGESRPIEALKITVSLSEITAVSSTGKTITLAEFPKDWVITDLSIGKFSTLVGKPFIIKSRKDASFVIDTGGHQNGGGTIKIYKRQNNFHVNQTWTIDKDGHLISWQNRNSILHTTNTKNSTKPVIVGMKESAERANSLLSKWRLGDSGQICSINQPDQCLDISGGAMKNDNYIHMYVFKNQNNQQWDIEELQESVFDIGEFKKWVGKKFIIKNKQVPTQVWDKGCDKYWNCKSSCTWTLTPTSRGNQVYTIDDKGHISIYNDTKNVYTALGGSSDSPVKMQALNATNKAQQWRLDTSGRISCAQYPNMFVTVSNGGAKSDAPSDGKPVMMWSKNDALIRQFWILEELDPDKKLTNDIGKFKDWVGKTIRISPRSCGNMYVDSRSSQNGKGGDGGGSKIGIWKLENGNYKANQEWQIDANGHILLAADKSYCIYASSTNNSTKLTLVKVDSLNQFDLKQYWKYDGTSILNLGGTKVAMDMDSRTLCKDGGEIHAYTSDGRSNQQWNITESSSATSKPSDPVKSMKLNPLTDVIVYEESLDKNKKPKKIEFHNGYRLKMYEIPDFSTFGITNVKRVEVKTGKEDNKQTNNVATYEGFTMLDCRGRFNRTAIIVFTILITVCIFAFIMYLLVRSNVVDPGKIFGQDTYMVIKDWWLMKGSGFGRFFKKK